MAQALIMTIPNMKKILSLFALAAPMLAGCGPDTTAPPEPPVPPVPPQPAVVHVTGIAVSPTTLTLTEGEKQTLAAIVSPADADVKSYAWSSGNTSIVTVDATTGEVTAIGPGSATITATTTDGAKTASCTVTVTPTAAEVALTEENAARFDEYLDELLAEYPDGMITLNAGDYEVEITMENLASLRCENIPTAGARISIKDSKIRITSLKSEKAEWGVGPGTTRSGEWFWLSEVNGVTPQMYQLDKEFIDGRVPVPINIDTESDQYHIHSNISLVGDSLTFVGIRVEILPLGVEVKRLANNGLWRQQNWVLDVSKYAIVTDGELDERLPYQSPEIVTDYGLNCEQVFLYVHPLGIEFKNFLPLNHEELKCLTSTQMKTLHPGKKGIGRPSWAPEWVPPASNSEQ